MADYPLRDLVGMTPLEAADTPNMDRVASCRIGLVRTIPGGMEPGSDVANLSILGYDPLLFHTGRAPLEAASMGIRLKNSEVAFRMNLVTLKREPDGRIIMVSHSSGDISTKEAAAIVEDLKKELSTPEKRFYSGVAYRHLLVWEKGPWNVETIPPHDVLDQDMAPYLTTDSHNPVQELIRRSWPILADHPVNRKRRKEGLKEANSIWLWGQGKTPKIPLFRELHGLRGGVISAVDLVRGIGLYAGFSPIHVHGATGYLDTNYRGKAEGALEALKDLDFVFLHVEAPDEAGHNGNYREKIQAIESFDKEVVGTVLEGLKKYKEYRVMIISDHFTPIVRRTHTGDPTPFAWADSSDLRSSSKGPPFTEKAAKESGLMVDRGHELMSFFLCF